MSSPKDRPIMEAFLESAEVVADSIAHGDVLSEIPVIGTAFKVCKAADAVRDRAFAAKLERFSRGLDYISEKERNALREKVFSSKDELRNVGETLFMVLERLTDINKPALLSKIFLAYLDGVVSSVDLRRLAQAVDASFSDDLQELLLVESCQEKSDAPWMQYLVVSGLTRAVGGKTYGDIGHIYYEVTELGHKLRGACSH